MNTKAIIASTLLTAVFAGQSAIAGQNIEGSVYAELSAKSQSVMMEKVNYSAADKSTISAELDAELFPQGEGQ
ncbi:hypothetical protein [uncultured Cocleimonas sp.]|uniref:hypothetical protein n=1 Tax=uncultured Cocleimonas sp. TaxID=1051587 RepID=UPI0026166C1A|nr:hypothetical protein [uncultured Cocleimonas sp.]